MLRNILYFFPVQLLVNHLKRNKTLLLFWLILWSGMTRDFSGFLGLRHLLLAPEYLDQSGHWSFFIMGIAMGGFTMVFHSTTCIIDMHRFPFVGALSRPFAKFCLNNSLIPLAFLITYVISIIRFQQIEQQSTPIAIVVKVLGFLTGFTLISILMFTYMIITNKDIFEYRARSLTRQFMQTLLYRIPFARKLLVTEKNTSNVISYLENPWRIGYTKDLDKYYDPFAILQIFNQNQLNLIFFELMAVALLFVLGFFSHHTLSQIPAAASGILFLAILMMLVGFLSFWARGWASTALLVFVVILNMLTARGFTFGTQESRAFGLRYGADKADYSLAKIRQINSRENYIKDKLTTLQILDNWRNKFSAERAPKLVIVCASGGGQKAALWVLNVLQTADSITNGKLMEHTVLMSCVSGGALGASYFRELCLRTKLGDKTINPYDKKHLEKIAHNTLNPIVFNLVTNDMLLDVNKFQYQGMTYRRDRGYALENQVNKQTDFILEKPLKAYQEPEFKSMIPMLLLTPTIINDGRKLFISPHQVSYYMGTDFTEKKSPKENGKIKGIDFMHFFKDQGAENLRFLSALRMTATYPYVLPSVTLPSTPTMEVMDAALFDNFGIANVMQFLYVFREWISKHTSGVILVTIRNYVKEQEVNRDTPKSLFQKLTNPIGSLQAAWLNMQDIKNENLIELTNDCFTHEITEIEFDCATTQRDQDRNSQFKKASLSWHLTAKEQVEIIQAIRTKDNQRSLEQLRGLLGS